MEQVIYWSTVGGKMCGISEWGSGCDMLEVEWNR